MAGDSAEQAKGSKEQDRTAGTAEHNATGAVSEPTGLIKTEHRLEGFEALLISRACLVGALLSLTVDTSDILSSMNRSKIVQVL
jgi:hypothetical protein